MKSELFAASRVFLSAALIFGMLVLPNPSTAAVKVGDTCKKIKQTRVIEGLMFTCVKAGKKQVWRRKGNAPLPRSATPSPSASPSPEPTPTPTPTVVEIKAPTRFEDLFENRKGIPRAAWQSIKKAIDGNERRDPQIEIHTGPNTKPWFEDYLYSAELVARSFPNHGLPKKTIVIRFNYTDKDWADQKYQQEFTPEDRAFINRFEQGSIIQSDCDQATRDCRGARFSHSNSGNFLIALGVWNQLNPYDPAAEFTFKTGMVEAHEYFHGLQMAHMIGKSLREDNWPPAWFREGAAQWVENAVINHADYENYRKFIRIKCDSSCRSMSELDIIEFLTEARQERLPAKFARWLNYNMGAIIAETLVAIKGHESLVDMYREFGSGSEFAPAFKRIYGIDWTEAIPILAKTVHAQMQDL